MWTRRVRLLDDVRPADWIAPRLTGRWGTVTGLVPAGFGAYARVLHPAAADDGVPVAWAVVAAVTGGHVHPTVQWHALVGQTDPMRPTGGTWPGEPPAPGNLDLESLRILCDVLAAHTATPHACRFGLWDGWAQLHGSPAVQRLGDATPVEPALSPVEASVPRLSLPGRDHLVLSGPLDAVEDLARYDGPGVWWSQSPSLIWPADRAWCVATDVDLDSTLVGGDPSTIDAVVAAAGLEAFRIDPDASLQWGSDHLDPGSHGRT